MPYYNTNGESGERLAKSKRNCKTMTEQVYYIVSKYPNRKYTFYKMIKALKRHFPLNYKAYDPNQDSVKRCLSDLANPKYGSVLTKLGKEDRELGERNKLVHTWKKAS